MKSLENEQKQAETGGELTIERKKKTALGRFQDFSLISPYLCHVRQLKFQRKPAVLVAWRHRGQNSGKLKLLNIEAGNPRKKREYKSEGTQIPMNKLCLNIRWNLSHECMGQNPNYQKLNKNLSCRSPQRR